eukprot:CAMPEP_0177591018 /NCGR_PEP_ID=MMETSP0419_2-20121207/7749_1 /TAXON_ID=582737 /ORGANISM="Tetraselmis sp., Strain GSL018" /LENGTH=38 /DNA_ID= /DNA_START= /DNA_END= /DNA_ORIENTATION=
MEMGNRLCGVMVSEGFAAFIQSIRGLKDFPLGPGGKRS